jgi:hypothetical protein
MRFCIAHSEVHEADRISQIAHRPADLRGRTPAPGALANPGSHSARHHASPSAGVTARRRVAAEATVPLGSSSGHASCARGATTHATTTAIPSYRETH